MLKFYLSFPEITFNHIYFFFQDDMKSNPRITILNDKTIRYFVCLRQIFIHAKRSRFVNKPEENTVFSTAYCDWLYIRQSDQSCASIYKIPFAGSPSTWLQSQNDQTEL